MDIIYPQTLRTIRIFVNNNKGLVSPFSSFGGEFGKGVILVEADDDGDDEDDVEDNDSYLDKRSCCDS